MVLVKTISAALSVAVISYLLGSLNFAIIVTKIAIGKDIRNFGSGNAGMTNVLRTVGIPAAVFTAIGDLGKGILSALAGEWIFSLAVEGLVPNGILYAFLNGGMYVGIIFALLGHLFPVYHNFKGGKGILVCGGAILIMDWRVFAAILILFLIFTLSTKIVSVGSIAATVGYPTFTCIFQCIDKAFTPTEIVVNTLLAAGVAAVVILMHRENIKRLINGTENRFGKKKTDSSKKD